MVLLTSAEVVARPRHSGMGTGHAIRFRVRGVDCFSVSGRRAVRTLRLFRLPIAPRLSDREVRKEGAGSRGDFCARAGSCAGGLCSARVNDPSLQLRLTVPGGLAALFGA